MQYVFTNRRRAGRLGFGTNVRSRSAGCAHIDVVGRSTKQHMDIMLPLRVANYEKDYTEAEICLTPAHVPFTICADT